MTPAERQAMRERCERATEGPWKPSYGLDDVRVTIVRCGPYPYDDAIAKVYGNVNAEFIYHARTDLPAALDALDAKDAEIERLRGLLREWTDMDPLRYDSEYSACPWCEFDYPNMRHEPDCAFVLARAECGIACNHELVTLPQVSDAPICHKCGALEGRE